MAESRWFQVWKMKFSKIFKKFLGQQKIGLIILGWENAQKLQKNYNIWFCPVFEMAESWWYQVWKMKFSKIFKKFLGRQKLQCLSQFSRYWPNFWHERSAFQRSAFGRSTAGNDVVATIFIRLFLFFPPFFSPVFFSSVATFSHRRIARIKIFSSESCLEWPKI